jgi:hypothetical protein
MAGASVHHLAQRRRRRAEHAGRGPLCARVRLRDLRWHRRDRRLGRDSAVIRNLLRLWRGGAVIRDLRWHRRDRRLGRGGAVKGWARPGGGRARIRVGCGWFGHGVFPWYVGSAAASSAAAGWRPAGTLRRRMGGSRPLTDAQQGRRQLPAAAAQGGRYRAGRVAGTAGCARAEPPAASLPLLCDGMTGGCTRPGQGRPPRGIDVAGIHRVTPPPGRDSGPAASIRHRHSRPGRGIASVMGTDDRDDRADAHELLREPREAGRCWRLTSGA